MMSDISNIDINSVFIHRCFAINKSKTIYINKLDSFRKDGKHSYLEGDWNCYVVISGLYKNGEKFKRMECRISPRGYREMKDQDRVLGINY